MFGLRMLFLAQHQVDHPAAADVRAGTAAVVKDIGVLAPGRSEGVRQPPRALVDRVTRGTLYKSRLHFGTCFLDRSLTWQAMFSDSPETIITTPGDQKFS